LREEVQPTGIAVMVLAVVDAEERQKAEDML
jgi:hypothetical protein